MTDAPEPSDDTKAAYRGESKAPEIKRMGSWTAIKLIMKIIKERAALRDLEAE